MLQFRLKYLLESKGIVNPYNYLIKQGFSPNVATRAIHNNLGQLKLSQVNKLCTLLQCTPNDLLAWVPGKDEVLPENHPLHTIVRNDKPFQIIKHINNLTLDQIKEVEKFIENIGSGENAEK